MFAQKAKVESIIAESLGDSSFRPEFWNNDPGRLVSNNCYTYALNCYFSDLKHCDFPRPGDRYSALHNMQEWWRRHNPLDMERHLLNDGLRKVDTQLSMKARPGFYLVACFVDLGATPDFHFMRQHPDGRWSQKIGAFSPVSDLDAENIVISDPRTASRQIRYGHESRFLGFFEVPNNGIRLYAPPKTDTG